MKVNTTPSDIRVGSKPDVLKAFLAGSGPAIFRVSDSFYLIKIVGDILLNDSIRRGTNCLSSSLLQLYPILVDEAVVGWEVEALGTINACYTRHLVTSRKSKTVILPSNPQEVAKVPKPSILNSHSSLLLMEVPDQSAALFIKNTK